MQNGLLLWRKIYSLRGGFEGYGEDLVEKRRIVVVVQSMIALLVDGQAFCGSIGVSIGSSRTIWDGRHFV
jgi:hypothetical protein